MHYPLDSELRFAGGKASAQTLLGSDSSSAGVVTMTGSLDCSYTAKKSKLNPQKGLGWGMDGSLIPLWLCKKQQHREQERLVNDRTICHKAVRQTLAVTPSYTRHPEVCKTWQPKTAYY